MSTDVVAGSFPTGPHTSGGIYVGGNGITCGPITGERYVMGIRRVAARAREDKTEEHPWGGLQDKRTVRIESAADTARRGDI